MASQKSTIFELLDECREGLIAQLDEYDRYDEGHDFPWDNHLWRGAAFRRAHLDVVDLRDTRKLYMMHLCVFPHTNDPAPIFGFDLIAGPRKVTGAFHDFSPVDDHPLCHWFKDAVSDLEWSKERELPDWARRIFSGSMVAAGNITDPQELKTVVELVQQTLSVYLSGVGSATDKDYTEQQNNYCHWQKHNPHTPRVMESLGFEPEMIQRFIKECLFPEI